MDLFVSRSPRGTFLMTAAAIRYDSSCFQGSSTSVEEEPADWMQCLLFFSIKQLSSVSYWSTTNKWQRKRCCVLIWWSWIFKIHFHRQTNVNFVTFAVPHVCSVTRWPTLLYMVVYWSTNRISRQSCFWSWRAAEFSCEMECTWWGWP